MSKRQIDSRLFSTQPDPSVTIQTINDQISCLQSENNRLEAKNHALSVEYHKLFDQNESLIEEVEIADQNIACMQEDITIKKNEIKSYQEEIEKEKHNTVQIQNMLLNEKIYDKALKELRQLQLKKAAVTQKLQIYKNSSKQSEFSHPEEAYALLKDDIKMLDANNKEIMNQISCVQAQVEELYQNLDQSKVDSILSHEGSETLELLKKIRDIKRISQDEDLSGEDEEEEEIYEEEEESTPHEEVEPATILKSLDEEIADKEQAKNDLLLISREFPSESSTKSSRHLTTLQEVAVFSDLRQQIRQAASSILQFKNGEDHDHKLKKLYAELETVSATLEAEELNAQKDAEAEIRCQKEIEQIDAAIEEKKNEIEDITKDTNLLQAQISQLITQRNYLRRDLDDLLNKEKPEVKKMVNEAQHYRLKYEDETEKLRLQEIKVLEKQEQVQQMKNSDDMQMYQSLMARKEELESKISAIKSELKGTAGTIENYEINNKAKIKQKNKLQEDLINFKKTLREDERELQNLTRYSNDLLRLLDKARKDSNE